MGFRVYGLRIERLLDYTAFGHDCSDAKSSDHSVSRGLETYLTFVQVDRIPLLRAATGQDGFI